MKRTLKIIATTAVLAAIIPLSAFAADAVSPTSTPAPSINKMNSKMEHNFAGKAGFGRGTMMKQISQELLTKLNLDEKTLHEKLAKGETLAEIAQAQGLSRDDLKNLLTTEFNQALDKQKADFTANLDALVDGKGKLGAMGGHEGKGKGAFAGPQGKGGHGSKGEGQMALKMDNSGMLQLLGVTNEELKTALTSGKSLADVATEKGVDVQKLIDLQVTEMLKKADQNLKDGKITQAEYDKRKAEFTTMATKMVNAKHDGKNGNSMMHKKGMERAAK